MTPQLWIALAALILLWDAARRFAERGAWCTRDEYDELAEWIDDLSTEAKTLAESRSTQAEASQVALDALVDRMAEVQDKLDFEAKARLSMLERLETHGKQLTNYGLSEEARAVRASAAEARTKILR